MLSLQRLEPDDGPKDDGLQGDAYSRVSVLSVLGVTSSNSRRRSGSSISRVRTTATSARTASGVTLIIIARDDTDCYLSFQC